MERMSKGKLDGEIVARKTITGGKGKWKVARNSNGFAIAIERDGFYILHLQEGTVRNEATIQAFVRRLNNHA